MRPPAPVLPIPEHTKQVRRLQAELATVRKELAIAMGEKAFLEKMIATMIGQEKQC